MKLIQGILFRLVCVSMVVGGVILIAARTAALQPYVGRAARLLANPDTVRNTAVLASLGALMFVLGLFGLFPIDMLRRRKTLTFTGTHGNVVIQLSSVEASLNRAVGKLDTVKKIRIRVMPTEDQARVRVRGTAVVYTTRGAGALGVADRVNQCIKETAADILGAQVVESVDISVQKIVVDDSKTPAVRNAPRERAAGPLGQTKREETEELALPGRLLPSDSASSSAEEEDSEMEKEDATPWYDQAPDLKEKDDSGPAI